MKYEVIFIVCFEANRGYICADKIYRLNFPLTEQSYMNGKFHYNVSKHHSKKLSNLCN